VDDAEVKERSIRQAVNRRYRLNRVKGRNRRKGKRYVPKKKGRGPIIPDGRRRKNSSSKPRNLKNKLGWFPVIRTDAW